MTQNQLFLNFNQEKRDNFDELNFIFHNQNQEIIKNIEDFFAKEKNSQRLILKGEKFSGKTYILKIFAKKYNAIFIEKNFNNFEENKFYILENIDEIADENLIFHIINLAFESKSFLIMSAKNLNNFTLNDLVSRLKNSDILIIKNPEIETVKILLVKFLSEMQLKISSKIIDFIALNIKRNYEEIYKICQKIEKFSFENKRDISLKEVKLWF